jgi:hypothetical protein
MFIKHKTKPDGSYDKTKARLVSDGSKQESHLYNLISSSTVSLSAVFMLLNIATYFKAAIKTYDIKGAFLNATFKEDDIPIYIIIQKEIAQLWVMLDPTAEDYVNDRGEIILMLDKYIYGLKQSPLKFQEDLTEALLSIGYKQCINDECIYVKYSSNGFSMLSTHVDDILQVSTDPLLITELHTKLVERYTHVSFNEIVDSYLGMTLKISSDNASITLSQKGLCKSIIDLCAKQGIKAVNTPAATNLFEIESQDDEKLEDNKSFLSIIMKIMYLARLTRPDLLLPVTYLASRAHSPTKNDTVKLYRVIKYLYGTQDIELNVQCTSLQMQCYCDASYGVHSDGRSHSGYIFSYNNSIKNNVSFIFARSYKQKLTAISSTDAEIIAACSATCTAVWLRNLHNELLSLINYGIESITFYQDNKSAIWLTTEPTRYRRSKHILTKISYIRENNSLKTIQMEYLPTAEMTADVLTKPLQGHMFTKHIRTLFGNNNN